MIFRLAYSLISVVFVSSAFSFYKRFEHGIYYKPITYIYKDLCRLSEKNL